jgi:polyketide cyclase/dehydrase/lipid transport protein
MATVRGSVVVVAPLADTWQHYFDPRGWPAWVDGFAGVEADAGYPDNGGTLRWRSTPAGRGTVEERVLEHAPRSRHRVAFSDPQSEGELTTTFAIEPGQEPAATRVTQELVYRLTRGGLFARFADVLFIRPQLRSSLERSLTRFKHEVEELAG